MSLALPIGIIIFIYIIDFMFAIVAMRKTRWQVCESYQARKYAKKAFIMSSLMMILILILLGIGYVATQIML